jgi:hypothetical protein
MDQAITLLAGPISARQNSGATAAARKQLFSKICVLNATSRQRLSQDLVRIERTSFEVNKRSQPMKNILVSAFLASAVLGACAAPAIAGHYVYVQRRPHVVVHRYVPYYPVRQVIYVNGRRHHAPERVVFVHRAYGSVYYDQHRRQYYRRDTRGNAILLGAVLGAIAAGTVVAATH